MMKKLQVVTARLGRFQLQIGEISRATSS